MLKFDDVARVESLWTDSPELLCLFLRCSPVVVLAHGTCVRMAALKHQVIRRHGMVSLGLSGGCRTKLNSFANASIFRNSSSKVISSSSGNCPLNSSHESRFF